MRLRVSYTLKLITDILFYLALAVAVAYILSDIIGVLRISRDLGSILVRLFFYGAPVVFLLSVTSFFLFGDIRFKWYSIVSGIEVLLILFIVFIMYRSQI